MPMLKVNDVNLYYELHGPENADVVVLSNGIFMSTASWGFQVAELKKHFRVLLYDCRGMWQSEHPSGPYSMDQHAEDLAELLKELGIKKTHIAGISYGGEISLIFALKYPSMVRSLVVSSSVSQIDPLLETIGKSWVSALESKDATTLFNVTLPYNFSEAWIKENGKVLEATRKHYEQMDFISVSELMAAFRKISFTARLRNISAPTLVLVGNEDNLKPPKYAQIIANEIPGAEFILIPNAGHAVCLEKPDAFNSALLGFLLKHSEAVV